MKELIIKYYKDALIIVLTAVTILSVSLTLLILPITTDLRDTVISLEQQIKEQHVNYNTCKTYVEDLQRQLEVYQDTNQ